MASLRAHLLEPGNHPHLPFHPDCPYCREGLATPPPERVARARRPTTALTAVLLAGSALGAAAGVPVAQAQVEEETEGTEELDGSGEADPEFEGGTEDAEAEREEPDAPFDEPPAPAPVAPPSDEPDGHGPAGTAPGVLNAPPPPKLPSPPPQSAPLPPRAGEGAPSLPPGRSFGRQPTPPRLDSGAPGLRLERRAPTQPPGAREAEPRVPERGGRVDLGPPPAAGPTLQPLPPPPLRRAPDTAAQEAGGPGIRSGAGSPVSYRVRPGDSLWSIAEAQLGPGADSSEVAREVGRLWALNGERIGTGEPDLILPDTVLRLR